MRKAFLLGMAALVLSVQDSRAAAGPTEQQWLSKLKQTEQSVGKSDARYGEMLFVVANFYNKENKPELAQPYYDRAMAVFEQSPGKNGDLLRFYSDAMARVYTGQGKFEKAEPLFKRSITLADKLPGKDKTFVVPHSLAGLAEMYSIQGKYDSAETALKQRIEMRHRFMSAGQVDVAKTDLATLYVKWGKLDQAKSVIDELLTIPTPTREVKDAVATYTAAKQKRHELAIYAKHFFQQRCLRSLTNTNGI
jgi:tetratricopeptide (TPR) repeat protein